MLIVHGGLALAKVTELRSILSNENLSEVVPAIVIVIGVLIFLISFLGCVGALQSNICLLETYSICLLVLVLFQVILACLIFLFVDDIKIDSGRSFSKIWRSRGNSANSQTMIELIQENLECCGYNNFLDYSNSPKLPKSCCNRHAAYCSQQFAYEVGCQSKLQTSIKNSAQIISYTCIGTAIFELIGKFGKAGNLWNLLNCWG